MVVVWFYFFDAPSLTSIWYVSCNGLASGEAVASPRAMVLWPSSLELQHHFKEVFWILGADLPPLLSSSSLSSSVSSSVSPSRAI